MRRRLLVMAAAVLGVLVFSSAASAATLGITAPPSLSSTGGCFAIIGQTANDASTPYIIPTGGGEITQWQTYTVGDTAGSSLTFAVLRPAGSSGYSVVAANTETLPNPLPSSHIASFTLYNPIQVAAGDTLALFSSFTSDVCYYDGGTTPSADTLFAATGPTFPPSSGETLALAGPGSPAGYTLNVAATLNQNQDAGVQTSTFPSKTDVAGAALLSSVVTNDGPVDGPITFVDQVPSGLRIESASAGLGTCAVSGQTVTCTITGLLAGQSTNVNVVVTTPTAGTYANTVTVNVTPGLSDPNSTNNTVSGDVVVAALPQECIVPGSLHKLPQNSARTLLKELGCMVHVVSQHSGIGKGLVLGVRGGARAYPYHQTVTLIVSSGPKKKKHKKHHLAR
ncbi:MAG TPA: DUF11 domain-containing protein [Solirubrobacteraceae bacterium]|nr:DUF11 domain-containing protein [Solirubrobacteraceae bacterium]